MKIENDEGKKILDKALNYAKNVTVDYTTKEGCNEYISNVIDKFKEAKKSIDELAENITYHLEDVEEALQNGMAHKMFFVGDELEFELLTGEPVTIVCIGKNHDILKNGEKATLTFAFKKCLDGEFEIDPSGSNECGWKNCRMRTVYLPRIFKLLPKVIQDLIVPVEKIANNGKDKKETVFDKLFLLSVREYTGTDEDSLKGEGEQYEYFAKGNKFLNEYWWTRSPYTSNSNSWSNVNSYGYINYYSVNGTYHVRPCFCIC